MACSIHGSTAGGGSGRPILIIPTGGGSSAQFEPVVVGLSEGGARPAIAIDYLGNGLSDKQRREVTVATLATFGVAAIVFYLAKLDIARGYILLALPLGLVVLLLTRWLWRQWLQARRRRGIDTYRVLLVGQPV